MFSCIADIFFFICCCSLVTSLYEGDKCSLKNGGEGTCKFLTQCPSALKLLRTRNIPRICGFEGTQSIVCCSDGGTEQTSTTTNMPTTIRYLQTQSTPHKSIALTTTNRVPGYISKNKCKEYGEYAYDRSESPTLSLFSHHNNVLDCPFEKLKLIVGGTLATRQEFPHMALIGYKAGEEVDWSCGGSIISENFILTAAHCVKSRLGRAALVRVGLTNKSDSAHMQELTVSENIVHPEYSSAKYHDIGLLKLSQNIDLNTFARPACLQTEKNIGYENAIASGWGLTKDAGKLSNDLLKIVLELFSQEKCNNTYRREAQSGSKLMYGIVDNLMICAGSTTDIKDTCQGDSGGPLQVYHDETEGVKCMYDIVGVTSFGKSCGADINLPGVYTRVSNYIKWIEDNVWPN